MSKFILFMDEVGAEFTTARVTRKEVIAFYNWQPVRFVPVDVRPIEVLEDRGSAKRAAGGFLLLGATGAALGVLLKGGPKVLFELVGRDGATYRGIVDQTAYPSFRRRALAAQHYRSTGLGKALWVLVLIVLGPIGCAILAIWGCVYLYKRVKRERVEVQA